jgi:hypothetical protein
MRRLRRKDSNYLLDRRAGGEQIETIERLPDVDDVPPSRSGWKSAKSGLFRKALNASSDSHSTRSRTCRGARSPVKWSRKRPNATHRPPHCGATSGRRLKYARYFSTSATSNVFSARTSSSASSRSLPTILSMVSEMCLAHGFWRYPHRRGRSAVGRQTCPTAETLVATGATRDY